MYAIALTELVKDVLEVLVKYVSAQDAMLLTFIVLFATSQILTQNTA